MSPLCAAADVCYVSRNPSREPVPEYDMHVNTEANVALRAPLIFLPNASSTSLNDCVRRACRRIFTSLSSCSLFAIPKPYLLSPLVFSACDSGTKLVGPVHIRPQISLGRVRRLADMLPFRSASQLVTEAGNNPRFYWCCHGNFDAEARRSRIELVPFWTCIFMSPQNIRLRAEATIAAGFSVTAMAKEYGDH